MQNKDLRLEQAEHNQSACLKLDAIGGFTDWVVTTAFYSAVHFIQYKLFPLTDHDGTKVVLYQTFIEFNDAINPHNSQSRHTVMLRLVKNHAKNVEPEYRTLYDNCLSARHSDYRIPTDIATSSKENLAAIKSYCNPMATDEKMKGIASEAINKKSNS